MVFASDHGFHLGEKEHWYKSTLWERATHVPLVVRGPGIEPGRSCDRPVSLLDVYPTLADIAGLPAATRRWRARASGDCSAIRHPRPPGTPSSPTCAAMTRSDAASGSTSATATAARSCTTATRTPRNGPTSPAKTALQAVVRELRSLLPSASAPPAPTKGRYVFDARLLHLDRKALTLSDFAGRECECGGQRTCRRGLFTQERQRGPVGRASLQNRKREPPASGHDRKPAPESMSWAVRASLRAIS